MPTLIKVTYSTVPLGYISSVRRVCPFLHVIFSSCVLTKGTDNYIAIILTPWFSSVTK